MVQLEQISPREAYAAYMTGSLLVDVRDADESATKSADLKRLIALPFSELPQRVGELPANRPVIVVSGIKSREAAKLLLKNGFQQVSTVIGGLMAWEAEGLPIRQMN